MQDEVQQDAQQPGCNCRGGSAVCPVQGRCQTDCVIYRATVTETVSGNRETYTGVTGNTFKKRLYGHQADMRKSENRHSSSLANHVWSLKDNGRQFSINWRLVDRSSAFNPITGKCRICLKEKKEILYNKDGSTLNKRNEIFNTCRHRTSKLECQDRDLSELATFQFWYRKLPLVTTFMLKMCNS